MFVGLVPWMALLVGTVLSLRRADSGGLRARRMAFMFWGVFLLTLSVNGFSFYRLLLSGFPALTGIRVISRIVHVLLLPLAYMTAVCIDRLATTPPRWLPGKSGVLVAVAACLVFAWESKVGAETMNKSEIQQRIATLERSLELNERRPKVSESGPVLAALSLNKSEPEIDTQLDAMLAAQDLNIVTLNGYSRFLAPGFRYF